MTLDTYVSNFLRLNRNKLTSEKAASFRNYSKKCYSAIRFKEFLEKNYSRSYIIPQIEGITDNHKPVESSIPIPKIEEETENPKPVEPSIIKSIATQPESDRIERKGRVNQKVKIGIALLVVFSVGFLLGWQLTKQTGAPISTLSGGKAAMKINIDGKWSGPEFLFLLKQNGNNISGSGQWRHLPVEISGNAIDNNITLNFKSLRNFKINFLGRLLREKGDELFLRGMATNPIGGEIIFTKER